MTIQRTRRYSYADIIVLGADDLRRAGADEFSEWALTVAVWKRDKKRFGMRGFQEFYPDHKRVSNELMNHKWYSPIGRGLMERCRPNTYRLTETGKALAAQMREPMDHYCAAFGFTHHPAFRMWQACPDEPRDFDDVVQFLGVSENPSRHNLVLSFKRAWSSIYAALRWCNLNDLTCLMERSCDRPITHHELASLLDFLKALSYRFPQLGKPT